MNKLLITTLATSLWLSAALVRASDDPELEPCMNGEVSASGTHPTQGEEDRNPWMTMIVGAIVIAIVYDRIETKKRYK